MDITQIKPSAIALPRFTLTFQAANGYQETYRCFTWDEYHVTVQALERGGFRLVRRYDRIDPSFCF